MWMSVQPRLSATVPIGGFSQTCEINSSHKEGIDVVEFAHSPVVFVNIDRRSAR